MGNKNFDITIVGSGVSGSFLAQDLARGGMKVLVLEAGFHFGPKTYPKDELTANSKLYWGGGVELNTTATLGILRPKTVGGGSVVNQALLDRFDEDALSSWRDASEVSFLNKDDLDPFYDSALKDLATQKIPVEHQNGNARIFASGFQKCNYKLDVLTRAQKDCRYHEGNHCINCLAGCPIESKQSMNITTLKNAEKLGTVVRAPFRVLKIEEKNEAIEIYGINEFGGAEKIISPQIILASGAIGNTVLLLNSGYEKKLPALGKNFYTHPQYMMLGVYKEKVNAHLGPLQTYKSNDPSFRKKGFKLENVFAPPVAISMLLPQMGKEHLHLMEKYTNMACIEVCVRDTNPGTIKATKAGKPIIQKELNKTDLERKKDGIETIYNIFHATGAKEIIEGIFPIGLHLMGGCNIGVDGSRSVVNPDFQLHNSRRIFCADSSIFPNAPGINPSFTIMALSQMAATKISGKIK